MKKRYIGAVTGLVVVLGAIGCNGGEAEEQTATNTAPLQVIRSTGKTTKETGIASWEIRNERGVPTIVGLDTAGTPRGRMSGRKTPAGTYLLTTTFDGTVTRELAANGDVVRETGVAKSDVLARALARDVGAVSGAKPDQTMLDLSPGGGAGTKPQGFWDAVGCVGSVIGFATAPGWGSGLRMAASCASSAVDVADAYGESVSDCLAAGGMYCGMGAS